MGRKNFGKKKRQQKKQKRGRKSSKCYPGIPQEEVTCREVAIYVPPEDEESDQESDYDDPDFHGSKRRENSGRGFGYGYDLRELIAAMMFWEIVEQRMMARRSDMFSGFSGWRARR